MQLQDKVVIVTGASAGIGHCISLHLAKLGCRVVLAARNQAKLDELAAEIRTNGGQCEVVPTDVTDAAATSALVDATIGAYGQIDVLVNNAGIDCFRRFETLEEDTIRDVVSTNLTSAMMLTRQAIPHMLKNSSGCVVNMASTAGRHCPGFAAVYGATKAALIGFTEGLRGEYLDRGITSTAICPGFTKDGGIYDRIVQSTGKRVGTTLGGTTAKAVAKAVEKAIRKGHPEAIVNWPPIRPVMVLKQVWPSLAEKIAVKVSRKFVQRAADAHEE